MDPTINLDEHRPHITINTSPDVHVYPTAYFRALANGDPVDPLPAVVLRTIIREWLDLIMEQRHG